ncbi:MAG: penicillin-binding protein activator LpoB [Treponemataceae bacterium]|nr:penicillin-binding protein activator LpoB [Treponemataceae bacterium]
MKKKILTLLFMAMVLMPSFAQKSGVEISAAVTDAAAAMARQMEAGKIAAVTRFSSDTKELSEWLENETFRALSKNSVRLVERNGNNMRIVDAELNFQYSGAVNEATISAYGQKLGARYIVYGNFEQFGGIKVLEFRMTDVESFEVLVAKTYEISASKLLTELLGSEAELLSIDDYIVAINNLESKRTSIEKDMASDCERTENRIRAEYQKRIDDVTTQITQENDGFLSPSALKVEIMNATKPLEEERDLLIKPVAENSRTKFADQLSMISNNRATIIKKLQSDTFLIGADSLIVNMDKRIGERNSYFTLNMNSTDKYAKFSLNDTIEPTDKLIFKKIRVALEETKSIKGEVEYKIRQSGGANSAYFDIVVASARIYDGISGDTFYKKTNFNATEADGGTINMAAQKTGTANRQNYSKNTTSFYKESEKTSASNKGSYSASSSSSSDSNTSATQNSGATNVKSERISKIRLAKNENYNNHTMILWLANKRHKFKAGDKIKFIIKGKTSDPVTVREKKLGAAIIDTTETATPKYWGAISDYINTEDNMTLSQNEEFEAVFNFKLTGTPSSTSADARKLELYVGGKNDTQSKTITIDVTEFTVEY